MEGQSSQGTSSWMGPWVLIPPSLPESHAAFPFKAREEFFSIAVNGICHPMMGQEATGTNPKCRKFHSNRRIDLSTLRMMELAAQRDCGTNIHNPIRCVRDHALSRENGPGNLQRSLPISSARSLHPPPRGGAERVIHNLQQLFASQGWSDV